METLHLCVLQWPFFLSVNQLDHPLGELNFAYVAQQDLFFVKT
ncbi:MAG TPA: hypothetical protein VNO32_24810 [Candidatus Acidoferrum sp.]|nr:hypothetical protein [Candidatus Acidoferrum sp.]